MTAALLLDMLRLVAVLYLVLLAVSALFGLHKPLLSYPFHAAYSTARLAVLIGTLGRVHLAEDARRTQMRHQRRTREWRTSLSEWREQRAEERAIARGQNPYEPASAWTSAAPAEASAAQASTPPATVPPAAPAAPPAHPEPALPPAPAQADEDAPPPLW